MATQFIPGQKLPPLPAVPIPENPDAAVKPEPVRPQTAPNLGAIEGLSILQRQNRNEH